VQPSSHNRPGTILFHVTTRGVGTWKVESLTSYIGRLADAHMVTPYALVHRVLGWVETGQIRNVGFWKRRTGTLELRAGMLTQPSSIRWVRLLEELTGAVGLRQSTLLGWAGSIPNRGLVRCHRAWCPDCYRSGAPVYDQLLWALRIVRACPEHECQLCESCPRCEQRIPLIDPKSGPGVEREMWGEPQRIPHSRP
jgi:hypothetical protein